MRTNCLPVRAVLAVVALWVGCPRQVQAQTAPPTPLCPSAESRIVQITIERLGVFESDGRDTTSWIDAGAKALHTRTRDVVVKRELLFGAGDRCNSELLGQTERNLRALGLFRQVEVLTRPVGGHEVAVTVRVRDAFTLKVNAGYKREGGTDNWDGRLGETNLAGLGFGLSLRRNRNFERGLSSVAFVDPRVLGSRERFAIAFDDRSDGHTLQASLLRPFHGIDARWSHEFVYNETNDLLRLYEAGTVAQRWNRRAIEASAGAAVRLGAAGRDQAWRASAGYRYRTREYSEGLRELPPDFTGCPTPRQIAGPFAGVHFLSHRYVKRNGLIEPDRDVDLNLGLAADFGVIVGQRLRTLGSRPLTVLNSGVSRGWLVPWGGVVLTSASGSVELDRSGPSRGEFSMKTRAWWAPSPLLVHAALVEWRGLVNPDVGNRVYLGGTPGLRGYRQNAFAGSSSLLLVVEERRYLDWVPLGLIRPGFVLFAEAGFLGGQDRPVFESGALREIGRAPGRFHGDVGIGLRLASPRLPAGVALRLDYALPLERAAGRARRPLIAIGYRGDF